MPVSATVTYSSVTIESEWREFETKFNNAIQHENTVETHGFDVAVVYTPDREEKIPGRLSDSVAKAYRSAERNRKLEDGEDAAATMYRRAIDVAIREKYPDVKGNLAPRIEALASKQVIPPALKDWADHIRWIGADGAHEPEGVTPEELDVLRGFTEAFLRYLITLPFEVDFRRGLIDKDGNPIGQNENHDEE
ncbi:MAG: DUF4145 domain-containing protein [Pseudomonadota bacterium]